MVFLPPPLIPGAATARPAAMIGAGVFGAFGPAAGAAGSELLGALGLAAVVAYCNATSSARLAARHPESGGTYVYGRERLGPFWGYLAGWSFVAGTLAVLAACVVAGLGGAGDAPLRGAIGFSSFGVLLYYAGALRLSPDERRPLCTQAGNTAVRSASTS